MTQATLESMSDSVNASTLPATTLIICSRNRPQLLEETVESVLRGDQVPAELLIIDQSAARHERLASWSQARGCAIRYEWTPVAGVSRARNIGIGLAQHELLVFIDDDMFVRANWFETLVGALLAAGPQAVVTGRVLP